MATTLPRFTKSAVRICSLQLPITELSHFRYLVAVDVVVGDWSNRSETLSLRSRCDGYRYQRKEVRPARHSSADAFVSKLPDAQRQASTAHWFQSSIWWISPRKMNLFLAISRCKSNAIWKILISENIQDYFQLGNVAESYFVIEFPSSMMLRVKEIK